VLRSALPLILALVPLLAVGAEAPATPKTAAPAPAAPKAPAADAPAAPAADAPATPKPLAPGAYARIKTQHGEILVRLLPATAPQTVANFIGLAKGERPFKDADGRWVIRPYFDGLTFHRVEKDSLIQGGCPKGDGTGGPGYAFDNEVKDDVKFDKPGRVAMANAGEDTNGSQIFITLKASPSFDGRYTIFGDVVTGLDAVQDISAVPATSKGGLHLAKKPVVIESVVIEDVPEPAKAK